MIRFTEDMKTGIPLIDSQHHSLIDFANKAAALSMSEPDMETMRESLTFLGEYVVKHFGDEERLQKQSVYPRYNQHRQIHQEFIRTFQDMCREFEKNGPSGELSGTLSNTVANWITTHIKMDDAFFGKHYMKTKQDQLDTHVSR